MHNYVCIHTYTHTHTHKLPQKNAMTQPYTFLCELRMKCRRLGSRAQRRWYIKSILRCWSSQVKILVNVTEDTNDVTLHAVDMKIDEGFTNVREYSAQSNKTKVLGVAEQRNDTDRQFHVIRTSDTLRAGKQYVVHLKFIGYLNDYLQGFYRSSYTVGNQTR